MRKLREFAEVVEGAARDLAPYRLTRYAEDLAQTFHQFYTQCHVLTDDAALTAARLYAVDATRKRAGDRARAGRRERAGADVGKPGSSAPPVRPGAALEEAPWTRTPAGLKLAIPFDLERFLTAQAADYATALNELRAGHKRSHWIWYVFPQLKGLGHSPASSFFGIRRLDEARAYAAHPLLGERLRQCVRAMLALPGANASDVLGTIDAMKFRSCLTLFSAAVSEEPLFAEALDRYFAGEPDLHTLELLGDADR